MNKHLSLLTAALLLTGASSAFAASTIDLTVTGKITPTACDLDMTNGGKVDYGKKSVNELNPNKDRPTALGKETIQLTVTCGASAQFAISFIDNQEGTAYSSPGLFGLGMVNGSEKLGGYQLIFLNPVAAIPVNTMYSRNDGVTWSQLDDDTSILTTDWLGFGNRTGTTWTADFLEAVTVDIEVNTLIAPANSLTLTNEMTLDGSATLQVKYL